jgi:uncharacterized protein YaeQ
MMKDADTVLLPFVVQANEGITNERGLKTAFRRAQVVLILVLSSTAEIIWTQSRTASVVNHSLTRTEVPGEDPVMPDWQRLNERLFTDHLWREYPGRIILTE